LSLDAAARRRYARQLLLGEIGEAGQERLLAARFRSSAPSDPSAFAVAAAYLRRAGCVEGASGAEVRVPDAAAIDRLAGRASLREPAAAVVGAFCAVEHLKSVLGLSGARAFPADLSLSDES